MRRTSGSPWATCSRKCNAAGVSVSSGAPAVRVPAARATQFWHCQGFLACGARTPLRVGTARIFWRRTPARHSALALPGISGFRHLVLALPRISGMWRPRATESWHCQVFLAFATQFWHCQGFLARAAHVPLNAGTAKDSWRSARPRPAHRVECLCTHLRRDGRAVECNGLENRRAALNRPLGSNPSPSASFC